ncbi:phosphoadenylyl-sulfate reductase [bacterium]|nr:MAG: phosphoadenylyl-sulfate reductase [bacterium]
MDIDLTKAPAEAWLEAATPQEILRWAVVTYGDKLTMATAFGAEGCAILDMLAKIRDETGLFPDVFNLDTGYQFGQTMALKSQIEKKYGIKIRAVSPDSGINAAEAESKSESGTPLYKSNPNACCYWRKVVPLKDALVGFESWITAIRRDQTPERASAAIVGPDKQYPLVKINPLANWTKQMVWDYIKANDVPYNPLHDQNFPSIGCWPCTRPVAPDQDDRAGRWAGSEKRECGIHLTAFSPR